MFHTASLDAVMRAHQSILMLCAGSFFGAPAFADIDPVSGIDMVTIGAAGNAPWQGNGTPFDQTIGRGSVGYEYRIGKFEVSTANWVEFYNAAYDRPPADWIPYVLPPQEDGWTAFQVPANTPGGLRWGYSPGAGMRPVGEISWHEAAIYCNWLHNGKSLDRSAFLNGAYDVSTFTPQGFTDQEAHHPGALYWIPTLDEWLKAVHYDPNKLNGDGSVGGWWIQPNMSDTPLTYGPPGIGDANAGWFAGQYPGFNPRSTLLGAYPNVQTPWGLLDAAGGAAEWTQDIRSIHSTFVQRYVDGSFFGSNSLEALEVDQLQRISGGPVNEHQPGIGLRIAAAVPSPGSAMFLAAAIAVLGRRARIARLCTSEVR